MNPRDDLDDRRFPGRDLMIAGQLRAAAPQPQLPEVADPRAHDYRLGGAPMRIGRDAEPVDSCRGRLELDQRRRRNWEVLPEHEQGLLVTGQPAGPPLGDRFGERVALADGRRFGTGSHGRVEGAVGGFEIPLHLHRRDVQRGSDVVETESDRVFRQQVLEIDIHTQQVAHRVLVLDAIQPAQHRPAFRLAPRGNLKQPCVDPLDNRGGLLGVRPRLIFRGHLAGPELLTDGLPLLNRVRIGEIRLHSIKPQPALRFRFAVALVAVLAKESSHGRVGGGRGEDARRARAPDGGGNPDRCYQPHTPDGRKATDSHAGLLSRCRAHAALQATMPTHHSPCQTTGIFLICSES